MKFISQSLQKEVTNTILQIFEYIYNWLTYGLHVSQHESSKIKTKKADIPGWM